MSRKSEMPDTRQEKPNKISSKRLAEEMAKKVSGSESESPKGSRTPAVKGPKVGGASTLKAPARSKQKVGY